MLTTILIVVIALCVVGIVIIVVRKFPVLASIDVSTIQKEKEVTLKKKLLEARFLRKLKSLLSRLGDAFRPLALRFAKEFHRWLDVVTRKGQKMRLERLRDEQQSKGSLVSVEQVLREADDFISEDRLNEAEARLVEFVALHPKEVRAYKRLASIAVEKKEYEQAKEIYEFILKLDEKSYDAYSGLGKLFTLEGVEESAKTAYEKSVALHSRDTGDYYALAKIYQKTNQLGQALEVSKKACELEPLNPKFLDKLAEIAILGGRKTVAKNAYVKLKSVNPENEKLPELKCQIDAMK